MATYEGIYGVDLDKTLAHYTSWKDEIGEPIMPMVSRVKQWLDEGREVVIFTARVALEDGFTPESIAEQHKLIKAWCKKHIGRELKVTALKSRHIVQFWDDRAVQVIPNQGVPVGDLTEPQEHPFPNGVPK